MPPTISLSKAKEYLREHGHEAPVCVTVKCVRCGDLMTFADCSLRYYPVGAVYEQSDICHECADHDSEDTVDEAETVLFTVDGKEVLDE